MGDSKIKDVQNFINELDKPIYAEWTLQRQLYGQVFFFQ